MSLPIARLNRRTFLVNAGMAILGQSLLGCGATSTALEILFLKNSLPPQLISRFQQQIKSNNSVNFKAESQLKTLFELLQTWQNPRSRKSSLLSRFPLINSTSDAIANLVTTGDVWLSDAIQKQFIQPLNLSSLSNWSQLNPRWHQLVQRNQQGLPDPQGKIWAAPYRWGTTMIVYRKDKFKTLGWTPKNWDDLWRKELQQRLSCVDQPREVIGLTLKKLGLSYNPTELTNLPQLKTELIAFQRQVKFFSDRFYLQPLLLGDVWAAIGWSNEILPLLNRESDLAAVIPESGTSLWADLWVQPKSAQPTNALLEDWLNFCWQPEAANQISLFSNGISPRLESLAPSDILPKIKNNPLRLIPNDLLERCEFLYPLAPEVQQQFLTLWKEVRQSA
ncbi:MAG: extracellular solute-binding protein [Snowella sp.]|nr:extracellular solute-binding protein [Snowella sp.]